MIRQLLPRYLLRALPGKHWAKSLLQEKTAITFIIMLSLSIPSFSAAEKPLPSWHDTLLRKQLLNFLDGVTTPSSSSFVPKEQRIAVFDVDGTLWVEKPKYPQLDFLQTLVSNLQSDVKGSDHSLIEWSASLTEGMTRYEYEKHAAQFLLNDSHHQRFKKPYSQLTYKPTSELIELLKGYDFTVYLCTASDASFIRSVSEETFGVPENQVIAQAINYKLTWQDGELESKRSNSYRQPINLGAGKVNNIINHTGQRPLLAVGNSLGDKDMLQWVASGGGLSLMLIHDDSQREYDYGKKNDAIRSEFSHKNVHFVSMQEQFKELF